MGLIDLTRVSGQKGSAFYNGCWDLNSHSYTAWQTLLMTKPSPPLWLTLEKKEEKKKTNFL